ncbi:phage head closure protein [Brevibacillus borstelensis]|uniref:phage head closure protein n=1 Tax=Brevibacillus borstelensis TaxID=45462 RepID=UPI0030C1889D
MRREKQLRTWDHEVSLIVMSAGEDEAGYPTEPKEISRNTVFANKLSVTQTEFYAANQSDMKADAVFEVHTFEYDGERILEHAGKRYEIIRTYQPSPEIMELTCSDLSQRGRDSG